MKLKVGEVGAVVRDDLFHVGFGVLPGLLLDPIHGSFFDLLIEDLHVRDGLTTIVSDKADHEGVDDLDLSEFGLLLADLSRSVALVIPLRRSLIHR